MNWNIFQQGNVILVNYHFSEFKTQELRKNTHFYHFVELSFFPEITGKFRTFLLLHFVSKQNATFSVASKTCSSSTFRKRIANRFKPHDSALLYFVLCCRTLVSFQQNNVSNVTFHFETRTTFQSQTKLVWVSKDSVCVLFVFRSKMKFVFRDIRKCSFETSFAFHILVDYHFSELSF